MNICLSVVFICYTLKKYESLSSKSIWWRCTHARRFHPHVTPRLGSLPRVTPSLVRNRRSYLEFGTRLNSTIEGGAQSSAWARRSRRVGKEQVTRMLAASNTQVTNHRPMMLVSHGCSNARVRNYRRRVAHIAIRPPEARITGTATTVCGRGRASDAIEAQAGGSNVGSGVFFDNGGESRVWSK